MGSKKNPPLVSVIVPVYNKADTVARTIASVLGQTLTNLELIIVDDGSTDNSRDVVEAAIVGNEQCTYVYQDNAGVAFARTNGVLNYSMGKYILCLDSDDAIEPKYLEHLVPHLDADRTLGIVYTGLWYIKPDGSEGESPWPKEFNADKQMAGQNQIPTAALVRREVWERLGGQRQRYAPLGAGAEDADFWLRAVSYGFGAQYVNPVKDAWFLYSWQSGFVTGNPDYQEVDYRKWSPWARDRQLSPTPSMATPAKWSHPARQYDEPTVSVIIPVGPGHAKYLVDALDSLDAQTFKRWEAIVVWDIGPDEHLELLESGMARQIAETWKFCRFASTSGTGEDLQGRLDSLDMAETDTCLLDWMPCADGPRGAGVARNIGLRLARAPLVLFLDADDWVVSTALEEMVNAYVETKNAIFSDHVAIATIAPDDLNSVDGKVLGYNEQTGEAFIEQGVTNYNCERALEQPYTDGRPPYIIANVTTLVPRKWIEDIGGFREDMESWEDVLLFWQLAWAGYCFTRIPRPLLVYRYGTGLRRDHGFHKRHDLLKYLKQVGEETEKMGCGCGGENKTTKEMAVESMATKFGMEAEDMVNLRLTGGGTLQVSDKDLVLIKYQPRDRGDKMRYGSASFNGQQVIYGRRDYNSQFLVHVRDVEMDHTVARAQGFEPAFVPVTNIIVEEEQVPEDVGEPVLLQEEKKVANGSLGDIGNRPIEDIELETPGLKRYWNLLHDKDIYNVDQLMDYDQKFRLDSIKGIGEKFRGLVLEEIDRMNSTWPSIS
jgi:glycosyltransferase involved in cell wall biosynthesis